MSCYFLVLLLDWLYLAQNQEEFHQMIHHYSNSSYQSRICECVYSCRFVKRKMCIFYFPQYLYHHTRLCKRKIGRHIANENSANKNQGFYQTKYYFQVLVIDYQGQLNHSIVKQKYPIYLTSKVYKITKETKNIINPYS